jgi:hypothetical protein
MLKMIDQLPSYYRASSDSFSRYFLIKETLKKVFGNKKIQPFVCNDKR